MMLRQRQPRQKDAGRLAWLRTQPCVICGDNTSSEAAHIRTGNLEVGKEHTGMAQKPDDKWTVSLCNRHHREQHSMNEMDFWRCHQINPFVLAMTLRAR
jgi:hypothetical protein